MHLEFASLVSPQRCAGVLAALVAIAPGLAAQTTVPIPCDRDNTLYESATGSLSNALGMGLFVGLTGQPGKRRAVLHFDIAAHVPAGARILSARLSLNVSRTAVASNFDVFAHRVLRDWGEGTSNAGGQEGQGTVATTNDATWLHAFYPATLWTNLGGDFVPLPSCAISTPSIGIATSPIAAGMNTDVQYWLDNPGQNFGWLLKTDELVPYKVRRFDSREAPPGNTSPSLVVSYLVPGQLAATWGQGCPVNGSPFQFAFSGLPIGNATANLVQTNGPSGALAVNLFALDFVPSGLPLLPQCSLYLPLGALVTHNFVLLDAAGFGSTTYQVPSGFPGVMLAGQSAALDSSPQGYVLSNAWIVVLN